MSCLLTKLEFASWLGVSDPYSFFGISEAYDGTNAPNNWQIPDRFCYCNLYEQEFEQAIERATNLFLRLANWIPIPTYFEDDFPYPYVHRGLLDVYHKPKKLNLKRCPIIQFGQKELNIQVEDAPLTKSMGGSMLEYFTLPVFQVPNTISKDQIRVFFTPTDAGYDSLNDCCLDGEECCEYEIKPLRIVFSPNGDEWDVSISGHAVIFKRPNLYAELGECLPNISSTYVDEVDIYLEEFDQCNQGYISFNTTPCSTLPCEDDTSPLCFKVYNKRFAEIIFAQCNDDDPPIMERYICQIIGMPKMVRINWQAGLPYSKCNLYGYQHHNLINDEDREILSLLTLHELSNCIDEWCSCEFCVNNNLKAWRKVQFILNPYLPEADPLDWISANPEGLNQIPTKAFLKAMANINLKNSSHVVC